MSGFTTTLEEEPEFHHVGSFNRSLVLSNLAYLIRERTKYSAFTRLSLDTASFNKFQLPAICEELIPDVCVYSRRSVITIDIIRMQEMPILAMEVIAPRQGTLSIIEKFQAYFALGIQSCWLIDPATEIVRVYHPVQEPQTFSVGEVIDKVVGIKFPVAEIFE